MSTHCTVSVKHDDDTVEGIYVHNNGFPAFMAPILLGYYDTRDIVEELISLGDASIICPKLSPDPSKPHSFDSPQKEVSVLYHRDRGEEWAFVKPMKASYRFLPVIGGMMFNYIFVGNRWYMWERESWYSQSDEKRLIPLTLYADVTS